MWYHKCDKDTVDFYEMLTKEAKKDMPHFEEQDRPEKVKDIYHALERDKPHMPSEMKARIAAKFGKSGIQHKGPPYEAPIKADYPKAEQKTDVEREKKTTKAERESVAHEHKEMKKEASSHGIKDDIINEDAEAQKTLNKKHVPVSALTSAIHFGLGGGLTGGALGALIGGLVKGRPIAGGLIGGGSGAALGGGFGALGKNQYNEARKEILTELKKDAKEWLKQSHSKKEREMVARKLEELEGELSSAYWRNTFDSWGKDYRISKLERKMKKEASVEKAIVDFLKKNPKPEDEQVHALATKLGIPKDELEEKFYQMVSQCNQLKNKNMNKEAKAHAVSLNWDKMKTGLSEQAKAIKTDFFSIPESKQEGILANLRKFLVTGTEEIKNSAKAILKILGK